MIFFNLEKHDGTLSESEMILSRHNLLFLTSKKSRFLKDTEYSLPSKYKTNRDNDKMIIYRIILFLILLKING